jgi:hypothetical protein
MRFIIGCFVLDLQELEAKKLCFPSCVIFDSEETLKNPIQQNKLIWAAKSSIQQDGIQLEPY